MNTNTKHTPGPWRAGDEARDGTIRIFSEKPYGSVADANSCYAGRVKHDAALIAAAPELLSALQAVYRQTVTLRLQPDDNCREMMRVALLKAEGRS